MKIIVLSCILFKKNISSHFNAVARSSILLKPVNSSQICKEVALIFEFTSRDAIVDVVTDKLHYRWVQLAFHEITSSSKRSQTSLGIQQEIEQMYIFGISKVKE